MVQTINILCYDALNSVYYLGGTYNSNNLVLTGILGQTLPPSIGYDAFIARFQDNGGADYKSLEFFKDSLSKAVNSNVIAYPNPSNGNFNFVSVKNETIKTITVSDITGRTVYIKSFENETFETNTNLSFLPASTYFVNISTSIDNYNIKIVIIK